MNTPKRPAILCWCLPMVKKRALSCNANNSAPNLDINANTDNVVTLCINKLRPVHVDMISVKTFALNFYRDEETSLEHLNE